jgi:hypothetical protein
MNISDGIDFVFYYKKTFMKAFKVDQYFKFKQGRLKFEMIISILNDRIKCVTFIANENRSSSYRVFKSPQKLSVCHFLKPTNSIARNSRESGSYF